MTFLLVAFATLLISNGFAMKIIQQTGSDGFDYVNTELVNKTDSVWQTRKLILCTQCTLQAGTVVAFQAYFRNAIAVKPLQFSVWAPDTQGMALLSKDSTTKIFTMILSIDYDPSSLGRENSVGCNNGIHTIIIPPGTMRSVNGSAVIGVIVQPTSSIVYNFNMDPDGTNLTSQLRAYDNLFDNTRLSPGESRQFGNLAVMEEIAFGAVVYPSQDLPMSDQVRIAADLRREKNCSASQSSTTPSPTPPITTTAWPEGNVPTLDDIDRGPPPPPNPNGWNLGNDASCSGPTMDAIRSLMPLPPQEPQMKIFIFAGLILPTGTVNGFQVCVGREVRFPGEGFRFQVWRRVDAKYSTDGGQTQNSAGNIFRLVGQTEKYKPANKESYTYLLDAKHRFNISAGDYFGFVNYGNETLISSDKASRGDLSAAIAFYELSNFQQALLIGEAYKFDQALQFNRYAASILINTNTTNPAARTPFDGPSGPAGERGPAGTPGPSGEKGATGVDGQKGPKGDQGPPGPPGAYIPQKGDQGRNGAMGPKGDQGSRGSPGPDSTVKGEKGPRGQNGTQGSKGERGYLGKAGSPGIDGVNGTVGSRGKRGAVGPANNEAVNITQCPANNASVCLSGSNGQCQVIERYLINRTSAQWSNTSVAISLPAKFQSSDTVCRCQPGYVLKSGQCVNFNECSVANGGCEYHCVDTVGSYNCKCPDGLKLANDGHRCDDVDECQQAIDPCPGDICLNRYGVTNALCLHDNGSAVAGQQQQNKPVASSQYESLYFYWKKALYVGLLAWLSGLSVILIVCIVLLAVFWPQMGKSGGDDGSLQSYDLPSLIDPKKGPAYNHPVPDWAAQLREDTYIHHGDVTNRY